jgi:hypothetical protein
MHMNRLGRRDRIRRSSASRCCGSTTSPCNGWRNRDAKRIRTAIAAPAANASYCLRFRLVVPTRATGMVNCGRAMVCWPFVPAQGSVLRVSVHDDSLCHASLDARLKNAECEPPVVASPPTNACMQPPARLRGGQELFLPKRLGRCTGESPQ